MKVVDRLFLVSSLMLVDDLKHTIELIGILDYCEQEKMNERPKWTSLSGSVHLVSRTHTHDAHVSVVKIVWVSHLVALALFSLQLLFLLGLG